MTTHLKSMHKNLSDDQQSSILASSAEAPVSFKALDCPFCDDWAHKLLARGGPEGKGPKVDRTPQVSAARFKRHVAMHMEQLAIFAVPRSTGQDGSSGSSRRNSLSAALSYDEGSFRVAEDFRLGDLKIEEKGSRSQDTSSDVSDFVAVEAEQADIINENRHRDQPTNVLHDISEDIPRWILEEDRSPESDKDESSSQYHSHQDTKRRAEADTATSTKKEKADAAVSDGGEGLDRQIQEEKKTELQETVKTNPGKDIIKFKDAVGRNFSFPFHLCATWQVSLS